MRCTTVAKLLYITAHPLDELASNSMVLVKHLLIHTKIIIQVMK